jgi:cysteine-rich repeat protein
MPECGDGGVDPGEECDDGNPDDFDECSNQCTLPECGDGVKAGPEQCDDGNGVTGDGCGECLRDAAFVFVTSKLYAGNFGGLAAADIQCQLLAGEAKLPGMYKAWLSNDLNSAASRIEPLALPYIRPDGKVVASAYATILEQPTKLEAPITVTELKEELDMGSKCLGGAAAWTGTVALGTPAFMANCLDWNAGGLNKALAGNLGNTDAGWTEACSLACTEKAHLYCFEVDA